MLRRLEPSVRRVPGIRAYAKAAKASAKAGDAPKVDQRQIAAQREREQRRQQQKREVARALLKLKTEARVFGNLPHTMDICDAMRYIRAAEVGHPGHSTTISLNIRVVAERGVPRVNGAFRLPHPLDEERICVLTNSPELAEEARRAGAAMVGSDQILNSIKEGGPIEFDRMYATPDIMNRVNQVARILGPKGLMPNVKRGTVTNDIYNAIMAARGELTFKQTDDSLLVPIGRASFTDTQIVRNIMTATDSIRDLLAATPSAKKGYVGRTLLYSTRSPSISIVV